MINSRPLISVVIPAYNHALFIERAIDSVLNQTYKNIELIVVNDGSKDNTWEEIKRIHVKFNGIFKIFTQENRGVCKTLNFGVSKSSGIYVAVLASDDYYAENKLEKQIKMFLESPDAIGLVHSSAYLDHGGSQSPVCLTGSYLPAVGACFYMLIEQGAKVVAPSVMFKRAAYDSVQGFDPNLIAEDVDFYVALAAKGWEFAYDPTPLVYKTVVSGSLGSRVEVLHGVHFEILEKYKHIIGSEKFELLTNNIYKHIIVLAAGNSQLGYALRTSITLTKRIKNPLPLGYFAIHAARNLILRAMPLSLRSYLRHLRSKFFYENN